MKLSKRERPYPVLLRVGLVLVLLLLAGMRLPVYDMGRQVVASGAADMAGGSYQMRGTVGQPGTTFMVGSTHEHGVGFWYTVKDLTATSVPELPGLPVLRNRLDQNIPNPFNPRTTINFALSQAGHVELALYDVRGRLVAELVNGPMDAGEHTLVFNGEELPSGVYIYQLRSGGFTKSRRFTLVK